MPSIDRRKAPVHDRTAPVRPQTGRTKPPPSPDPTTPGLADVARWLSLLTSRDVGIEIRAPRALRKGRGTPEDVVRRFPGNRVEDATREALNLSGHAPAVYFVLNGIAPALVASRGKGGARAADVPRRRFLLIDCDPTREGTVSATDGEKAAAEALARQIRTALNARGWPAPIVADSGNGYHLVYSLDLPNDAASTALVKGALEALAARNDTPAATVDRKVHDAPRLVKLYGTLAMKGTPSAERPHRFARVLDHPERLDPVRADQLAALVSEATTAPSDRRIGRPAGGRRGHHRDPTDRAIRYLNACQPAVSGQGGHDQTFKVCSTVGPGFDLSPAATLRLVLEHYNPRCDPPWSEAELRHKVDDAYRVEVRRGFKLDIGTGGTNGRPPAGGIDHPRDDDRGGPPPASDDGDGDDGPRVIIITTREHRVIDQAAAALGDAPEVFQRGNALMTVLRDDAPKRRAILRPPGSPRIAPLPGPTLREILTRQAQWEKPRKTRSGDEESVPAHPPEWAVAGVAARGHWPEIRPIEAIVEAPSLRPDGTVIDRPGYDELTALLFEPNAAFPSVPERPSQADARAAAETLLRIVVDFPFAGEEHKAAWLASLLTPLARFAIAGPCPLFLIDANSPGSGKSKLTDIVAIIATGRGMPRTSYPETDDEMRKRISSIALAGDRLMLLDNIGSTFGGPAIDAALTATTWKDRALGRMEMTPELPLSTVWYATGNNVTLRGDVLRRVVPYRLETREERPEERRDFTIRGDLLDHVRRERPRLVAAALTILRAHAVAGRPDAGLEPLGSFEAWSKIVRSAVRWAIGIDPCRTRDGLQAADPESLNRIALVEGFAELLRGEDEPKGMTVAAALKVLKTKTGYDKLRDCLMEWSRNDDLPSAQSIGKRLKAIKGRVILGRRVTSLAEDGTQVWRVEDARQAE